MKSLRLRAVVAGAVLTAVLVVTGSAQTDAAALYKTKCQVCHGADEKAIHPWARNSEQKIFMLPRPQKCRTLSFSILRKKARTKCRHTAQSSPMTRSRA